MELTEEQKKKIQALKSIEEAVERSQDPQVAEARKIREAARETAIRYLALDRGKPSGKVRDKLYQAGFDREVAEEIVEALAREGWQDETLAARRILCRHQGSRAKSRMYLQTLLKQQGIQEETAEAVCLSLPPDEESIWGLIRSDELEDEKQKNRLIRRLCSRGYRYETILSAIRECESHEE